jgi:hypothetical protein
MRIIGMLDEEPGDPATVRRHWWSRRLEKFAELRDVGWFKIKPTFRAATDTESRQLHEYRREKLIARMRRESIEKERQRKLAELQEFNTRLRQVPGLFVSTDIEEP